VLLHHILKLNVTKPYLHLPIAKPFRDDPRSPLTAARAILSDSYCMNPYPFSSVKPNIFQVPTHTDHLT